MVAGARAKLSQKAIDAALRRRDRALEAGERFSERLRDAAAPGLFLDITGKGGTWFREYRPAGWIEKVSEGGTVERKRHPSRTLAIGTLYDTNLDDARRLAAEIGWQVSEGRDPAAEKRDALVKAEAARRARKTCRDIIPDFEADLSARQNSDRGRPLGEAYVRTRRVYVEAVLSAVCNQSVTSLDLAPAEVDASALLEFFDGKAGSTARHQFGAVSQFFDFCARKKHRERNPLTGAKPPKGSRSRSRVLTAEEVRKVWESAANVSPLYRDLIRLAICLPARMGEFLDATWADFDLDTRTWRQPDSTTKNGDPHRLHLHDLALEVLTDRLATVTREGESRTAALARLRGSRVFPGRAGRRFNSLTSFHEAVLKASGTSGWTPHDLRRTFASHLAEAGVSVAESVIDAVLNHRQSATRGGVLGVYQRASRQTEQDAAVKAWGSCLASTLKRPGAQNVVALTAAG